jgi:4a-hydroxytetrahydrobiopterin dehydratase
VVDTPVGWSIVAGAFVREFTFPTFAAAAEFVARVGRLADDIDHHPEVSLRYPGIVTVYTTSHDADGVTARDVRLVALVDALVEDGS